MIRVFADTSFYVAMASSRDASHALAETLMRAYRGHVVTTEYVLVELGNWLARSGDRSVFVELNRHIHADTKTLVVPAGPSLYDDGIALYEARLDKDWSLTDCISFCVMGRFSITSALTADRHFQQAGFTAMLHR